MHFQPLKRLIPHGYEIKSSTEQMLPVKQTQVVPETAISEFSISFSSQNAIISVSAAAEIIRKCGKNL